PQQQRDKAAEQLAAASETLPPAKQDAAPTGKAYVVQLGALKNADKVNEVVGKLRSAGYRVYTSPSTPVQGKITRILVGPGRKSLRKRFLFLLEFAPNWMTGRLIVGHIWSGLITPSLR
ncbi:SPOR domain-containing protein, partial [Enterobacter hormaechei]|uniref:SPOR domain-containing protein n=1 Tax=Enterobacter hormaechei TaxID=158836 RepID=UPI000AAED400